MCRELCEKRIRYEEIILDRASISLEKCVKVCEQRAVKSQKSSGPYLNAGVDVASQCSNLSTV